MLKTPSLHYREHRFNLWSLRSHMWYSQKEKRLTLKRNVRRKGIDGKDRVCACVYVVVGMRLRDSLSSHSNRPKLERRQWHPTPVLLTGKSHGWRSLEGCSPWGHQESDMTEWLHFHFSFSCVGEGNGNPLQCSFLENPRDGGAWWVAVYGVTQSRTRLKRLSSSSSSSSSLHVQMIGNALVSAQYHLLSLLTRLTHS